MKCLCHIIVILEIVVSVSCFISGCGEDGVDRSLQGLCYEWTGRMLGDEILKNDKFDGEFDGIESYNIAIDKSFKGCGGNPYVFARKRRIVQVVSSKFDFKPFPSDEEFRESSIISEFTSRLGVKPTFHEDNSVGIVRAAVFRIEGKVAAEISIFKCKGDSVRQKDIAFFDYSRSSKP